MDNHNKQIINEAMRLFFDVKGDFFEDQNLAIKASQWFTLRAGKSKAFSRCLYDLLNDEPVTAIGYQLDDLITGEEVMAMTLYATAEQRMKATVEACGGVDLFLKEVTKSKE